MIPCPACSRHVRAHEAACPFCDAALPRPRSVSPGLAAAAGAGLVLLSGCPDRMAQRAEYGAPPPPPAPITSDDAAPEPTPDADPAPDADRGDPAPVYGAPPPEPDDAPRSNPDKD